MRCKNHDALECCQRIVDSRNGFQIKMVRRLIEQQHIRAEEHHPGEHAAHLLAAGEHIHALIDIIAGKEHLSKESAQECIGLFAG